MIIVKSEYEAILNGTPKKVSQLRWYFGEIYWADRGRTGASADSSALPGGQVLRVSPDVRERNRDRFLLLVLCICHQPSFEPCNFVDCVQSSLSEP